jgi:beta-alanine degradation protein BauB
MHPLRTTALASSLSFLVGAGAMWAQKQGQMAQTPQSVTRREPQFENTHVRAWKSTIMPNQPLSLHRHDHGRALIALVGGRLNVVDGNGKVLKTYDWESGKAYWLDADPAGQMHADRNDTSKPIEVIVVELKQDR